MYYKTPNHFYDVFFMSMRVHENLLSKHFPEFFRVRKVQKVHSVSEEKRFLALFWSKGQVFERVERPSLG